MSINYDERSMSLLDSIFAPGYFRAVTQSLEKDTNEGMVTTQHLAENPPDVVSSEPSH